MQAAIIIPTDFLEPIATPRPFHMALAHRVLSDNAYAEFYASLRNPERSPNPPFILMDNSLMENGHVAISLEDVEHAAIRINADEVVLPDAFRDFQGNNQLLDESMAQIRVNDKALRAMVTPMRRAPRVAGVVQGSDPLELHASFEIMARTVDTICIPKVVDDIYPEGGRLKFIMDLEADKRISSIVGTPSMRGVGYMRAVHLLGVWNRPAEIYAIESIWPGMIRSVDSALPFHAGLAGHRFHTGYGMADDNGVIVKAKRPDNYLDICRVDITEDQGYNIAYNIYVFDGYAEGKNYGGAGSSAETWQTIVSSYKRDPQHYRVQWKY